MDGSRLWPLLGTAAALALTLGVAFGFGNGWSGALALLAIYFVIWWTVLFAVLPFNVRSQAEADDLVLGTERGAPVAPGLSVKAFWTTVTSLGIFTAFLVAQRTGAFDRFIDSVF